MPPEVPGVISRPGRVAGAGLPPGPKLTLDTGPLDLDRDQRVVEREDARDDPAHPRGPRATTRSRSITDAEYLDAKWGHPFEDTRPAPFEGAGEVTMMRVEARFEHGEDAIRLPYAEHDLRFVAMLGEWHEVEWRARPGHGRAAALHDRRARSSSTDAARAARSSPAATSTS